MTSYKFRVYYQWIGRTKSAPFAMKKSPEEIATALERAPFEFSVRLPDLEANVRSEPGADSSEILLFIETTADEHAVDEALVTTLQDWNLFADKS